MEGADLDASTLTVLQGGNASVFGTISASPVSKKGERLCKEMEEDESKGKNVFSSFLWDAERIWRYRNKRPEYVTNK